MKRIGVVALLLVLLSFGPARAGAQAKELHVAAAADMHPVFDVIGPIFEARTGIKLQVSYGASATLAKQVTDGAPFDIFFSADYVFAERVVAAGLSDSTNPEPYAKGALVLWARKDSGFNPVHLEVLERKDIKSVAIANPETAPYGRAALAAIKKMNLYQNVAPHFVQAESVAQAGQFAESGNAQLGLLSQTIAMTPKFRAEGTFVLFPLYVYPEIRQTAVILNKSPQKAEAHKLLDFVLSPEIQGGLTKVGLYPVK